MDEARSGGESRPDLVVETRYQRDFGITLLGFPKPLQEAMQDDVNALAFLIPPWCSSVRIAWLDEGAEGEQGPNVAATNVAERYRWAAITIRPAYFDPTRSDAERLGDLAHEFLHILLGPMQDWAADRFDDLVEEGSQLHRNLKREWRARVESVTEDCAQMVQRAVDQRRGGPPQATPRESP